MPKGQRIADTQKAKRQFMGALGIESEEQWSNQGIRRHGAGFYDVRGDKDFRESGKKKKRRGLHIEIGPL